MQRRDTQCHLPARAPHAFQGKHRPQSPALADLGPFETHDVMSTARARHVFRSGILKIRQ